MTYERKYYLNETKEKVHKFYTHTHTCKKFVVRGTLT